MATTAGVGFSERVKSRDAGVAAARMAANRSRGETAHLVFVMATAKHNPDKLVEGVRSVVGAKARLIGAPQAESSRTKRLPMRATKSAWQ